MILQLLTSTLNFIYLLQNLSLVKLILIKSLNCQDFKTQLYKQKLPKEALLILPQEPILSNFLVLACDKNMSTSRCNETEKISIDLKKV